MGDEYQSVLGRLWQSELGSRVTFAGDVADVPPYAEHERLYLSLCTGATRNAAR